MKKFFAWLGKTVGSALTLALTIVLLPHAGRFLAKIMPDESGSAIKTAAIISQQLTETARLETLHVDEEGALNYEIKAAFIGTVASVNVRYDYEASFGIDLKEVDLTVTGNEITFHLPTPSLLNDSLTPIETYRNDDWYPYFDDNDYQKLLDEERLACRTRYLSGEYAGQLWEATTKALDETIAKWLTDVHGQITIHYEMAEQAAP